MIKAVFFDAGNTLVFPDYSITLAPLKRRDISVDDEHLLSAERAARRYRDSLPSSELSPNTDHQYWVIYFRELLGGHATTELVEELVGLSRAAHNWTSVAPGTRETLLDLRRQFYVGVISNSDGHMAELLAKVGLGDCFEAVIDSTVVGYQKPDPGIFHAALERAGMMASESVYVGDIYSIDYLGATAIGMKGILIDRFGTYSDFEVPQITNLSALPELIKAL